jgi:hypothetical protein
VTAPSAAPGSLPARDLRYRQLSDAQIIDTIDRLAKRIDERFPGAGLTKVARELHALAIEAAHTMAFVQRPHYPLRLAAFAAIGVIVAGIAYVATTVKLPSQAVGISDVVQAIEASVNDLIFLVLAIYFLFTIEGKVKRRRALTALHELRSVVHIVDMHQLTKDPERMLAPASDTPSSPQRLSSPAALARYLDYCSEMLSLSSKVAALYVQRYNDPVVLGTVNEIESLAASLSNKIWQKITLIR